MDNIFITELNIRKVRHLTDINIPLSKDKRKNLVLTGKNGSGKTSVLEALAFYLQYTVLEDSGVEETRKRDSLEWYVVHEGISIPVDQETNKKNNNILRVYLKLRNGVCEVDFEDIPKLREKYKLGQFILAYYSDNRKIDIAEYKNIEKVNLKPYYAITEKPSKELGKYLVNLKSIQAFATAKGDAERAAQIADWFERFENILRRIYQDDSLKLDFDIETFQFSILLDNREPFSFNTMSMGYAAVFDIIGDLMMRMESQRRYDLEGIVLIDEIETHLHVELQKEIVPILTELFPNIQFILTTHSPFVLNSAQNAVVYDLEKKLLVEEGLADLPYEGIVEGYFNVDLLSQELREKFEEYKKLVKAVHLEDSDYARIAELEVYLDEVPDYLALDFAEEYSRLKAEIDI